MFQIRPNSIDSSIEMLQHAVTLAMPQLEQDTHHWMLWKGYASLLESAWTDDVLRPLYSANVLVQVCTHAIIPKVCGWLATPSEFNRMVESEANRAKYAEDYRKAAKALNAACTIHEKRCGQAGHAITTRMIRMRRALQAMHKSVEVQTACELLYSSSHMFRIVFGLQNERMIGSLHNETDIETSMDVPFAIMGL